MSNSTDEFWDINGVSLNQFGWNIKTFGGSRLGLPPLRGDDQEFAYAYGKNHHDKYADSRTVSLDMWVVGTNPDGTFTGDQALAFNDAWQTIRKLVWKPKGGQVTLTRRWRLTNPLTGLAEIYTGEAKAQITGNMEPTMTGRTRADFVMDLLLADPYFYMPEVEVEIPYNTPTVVFNPGDEIAGEKYFQVDFNAPTFGAALTNPKLTNSTSDPDVWFRFSRKIPDVPNNILAPTITFDVEDFQIEPAYLPISLVTHSGTQKWFGLLPGNNTVTLTSDAGTGSATIRYRPPCV